MISDPQETIVALARVLRRVHTVYEKAQASGDKNIETLAGMDVLGLSDGISLLISSLMHPARLMTLEEAKAAKIGWFEFWSAATGKHFVEPCVVKEYDNYGYVALDNTGFGRYCGWRRYNDAVDIFRWRVWTEEPTNEQREEAPWTNLSAR